MRDQLIGYLLDALEPAEHEMVEAQLSRDPQLKQDLELLSRSLLPLAADKDFYEPPVGLTHRTCEFVAQHSQIVVPPPQSAALPGRWTLADLVVAAGIFFAAALLFFPAMNQSRFAARLAGCQNNLRQIGVALANYSTAHNGFFPNVPLDGSLAVAGVYAPRLVEQGFLNDPQAVVCPASKLAEQTLVFRVPTMQELQAARGQQLAQLHQQVGGSYGYNLGYVANGQYQTTKNLGRVRFAILSDAPNTTAPYRSLNHGGCGQNVLFEDMHVHYMTTCKARGCTDDIFLNDDGQVAPGCTPNDAVIVPSHLKPLLTPVSQALPESQP